MLDLQPIAVMLDFDGPVCSVFARYSAAAVTRDLVRLASAAGLPRLGDLATDDPLEVVRFASVVGLSNSELEWLDSVLTALEVKAVAVAEPTEGARQLIETLLEEGLPMAIVSNNSEACVRLYWSTHELPDVPVVGRPKGLPHLMKPRPHLLLEACHLLGVAPTRAVMIGDSVTDIEAASAAGAMSIGYANKPGKAARLRSAGASAVVSSIWDAARLLICDQGEADQLR